MGTQGHLTIQALYIPANREIFGERKLNKGDGIVLGLSCFSAVFLPIPCAFINNRNNSHDFHNGVMKVWGAIYSIPKHINENKRGALIQQMLGCCAWRTKIEIRRSFSQKRATDVISNCDEKRILHFTKAIIKKTQWCGAAFSFTN